MGRRRRNAERSRTQGASPHSKLKWVTGLAAAAVIFVVTILAGIAQVLALPGKKIIAAVAITAVVVVVVAAGSALWNLLQQVRTSKIRVLAIVLFTALGLVIGPLVWTQVLRDESTVNKETASKPSSEALVLVADFGAPDTRSAGAYRVSEIIQEKLQVAFSPYRDVRVAPLGRLLTAKDGSQTARAEGRKRRAAIVIWGWYGKSSTTVVLSVHFELIAPLPDYAMPTLGPYTKGQIRKEPLHKLESFSIQEDLSSELISLSETSVGLIRLIAEDYDGAISHFIGALRAHGGRSSAEVRANRGMAYLNKAFGLSPNSAEATLKQAEADFTKVINQQPSLHRSTYYNRGQAYLLLGEYDRSVSDFTNAIRLTPDDANYNARAQAYAAIPDYPKAIADATHAIRLRPNALNHEERGRIYLKKRDMRRALMDFNKAIQLEHRSNSYTYRAILYGDIGRKASALEDLNKAIQLEPTADDWYYNRGIHYAEDQKWDAALADYNKAIELAKTDNARGSYYHQRGRVHYSKGNLDQAINDFNWVISRLAQPDIPDIDEEAYYNRGRAFQQKREWAEAIADFTAAIQVNGKSRDAYLSRGMLYHHLGQETKSISDLSRVLQLDPDSVQALATRSDAYIQLRDYGHDLSDIKSGIRTTKDPIFFFGRARVMAATGHRAEATRDFHYVITHSRDPELRKAAESSLEELARSSSP